MSIDELVGARPSVALAAGAGAVSSPAEAVATLALRCGLAYVFLIFGAEKVVDWRGWAVVFPPALADFLEHASRLEMAMIVRLLGYGELVLGLNLALGVFTRSTAAAAASLLLFAVVVMGSTGIGVRDTGLAAAAVAVAVLGGGPWSFDARLGRPKGKP